MVMRLSHLLSLYILVAASTFLSVGFGTVSSYTQYFMPAASRMSVICFRMPQATMPLSVTMRGYWPPRAFMRLGISFEQPEPTRVTLGMKKEVIWPMCMDFISELIPNSLI